jgi:myo-inositol-1(or 4)-monophosphatase
VSDPREVDPREAGSLAGNPREAGPRAAGQRAVERHPDDPRGAGQRDIGSRDTGRGDRLDLSPDEIDRLVAAAEAAADVAGAIVRPFFRSGIGADLKDDRSPVTIADRTAELAMRAVLTERLPDHGIIGEEFGDHRPDARLRWVLDPIDGTRAFITGRLTFGTLIGLLDGDTPILGVIDQPITGERWIGAPGRPTIFRGPLGGHAGCRPCPDLAAAELSCTSTEMLGQREPAWRTLAAAVRRNSWGGDCYAHALLALGQIDIVAECDMKLWDWAALVPVVEGAGGRVTDWKGNPLRPGGDGSVLSVGDPGLLAPAVALLNQALVAPA